MARWALGSFLQHEAVVMTAERQHAATDELLANADTDGSGCLDFREFESWFTATAAAIQAQRRDQELTRTQKRAQQVSSAAQSVFASDPWVCSDRLLVFHSGRRGTVTRKWRRCASSSRRRI